MPTIVLSDAELQSLINVIANAPVPWVVSNPLLMKIGSQQSQAPERQQSPQPIRGNSDGSHSDAERGAGQILGQAGGNP